MIHLILWGLDGAYWTWLSGDNAVNQNGIYSSKGVAATANMSGSRWGSASWIDSNGNL
jgi:hypothetical protein